MADLTSVAPVLKEVWQRGHETAFNEQRIALSRIERTFNGMVEDLTGRYVVIPLRVRRPQGIGSRPERGILPLPGQNGYVATRVEPATQYGVGEITRQTLKLVDGDPAAAIVAIDEELSGLRESATKDYNRMVYGNASGALGTVAGIPVGNVITVDKIQYFEEDMYLDAYTSAGVLREAALLVTDVDPDAKTITVDAIGTVANTDVLYRNGNRNQEINGFGNLVDDTVAVQNLSPATERRWASHVIDTGAPHAYDELELLAAFDRVKRATGPEKEPTVMFTEDGVERAMFATLKQSREFVNTIEFAHGYSALPFNRGSKTVPVVNDPDFPTEVDAATGQFLGVHEPSFKLYVDGSGWQWAEETGSMFIAATDRSDTWEFRLYQISQLGMKQRNNHFRVKNINRS